MTYPELNGTLVRDDLMELFVYSNVVTGGLFGLFITMGFFLVVFIGVMMSYISRGRDIEIEKCMLAASFATLGWATILEMSSGILNPVYFFVIIGITILSMIWVAVGD